MPCFDDNNLVYEPGAPPTPVSIARRQSTSTLAVAVGDVERDVLISTRWRLAGCPAFVFALLIFADHAAADEVTLKTGATVRGRATEVRLPDHSRVVEIQTSTGALIVLERDAVKQIKRGAATAQKSAGKPTSNKPRLTAKEQAWMTKVRLLAAHLLSDDRERSRRARSELLSINDPDALPALTRYLQQSSDEELRHLYVAILRELPGPNTVYYLVQQSLFDPAAQIREQARHAIGPERADSARTLYIYALKLHSPNLASRAALGIQEVGDPNGDAIPYLIEALVHVGTRVITLQEEIAWFEYYPTFDPPGASGLRLVSVHEGAAPFGQLGEGMRTGRITERVTPAQNVAVNSPPQQIWFPYLRNGKLIDPPQPPLPKGTAMQAAGPLKSRIVAESDGNPTVLETLLKLTDHTKSDFGYNRDNWRSWWANEKASRDSQRRPTDKPITR
jgi:hypothetical protein